MSDAGLETAAGLAVDLGVGVHIHVAEGIDDIDAGARLAVLAQDDWLLVHCVHLDRSLPGTIAHNPRSNMNNAVGYAQPTKWANNVVLGTDGIGADMLEEARLAFVRLREHDVTQTPDTVANWLECGYTLFPEARHDLVRWNYDHANEPWRVAYTPGMRALDVTIDDNLVLDDGLPTRVDITEIRAKAAEQAQRLFYKM